MGEEWVLIDEDAELPDEHYPVGLAGAILYPLSAKSYRDGYAMAQKDMLAAGWRKVKEARE